MIERIKSWESPRKRGRNKKGKGGAARARQLRKREKLLRKKLKQNQQEKDFDPSFFYGHCQIRNQSKMTKLLL